VGAVRCCAVRDVVRVMKPAKRVQRISDLRKEFLRRKEDRQSTEPPSIELRGLIVQQLKYEVREDKREQRNA
jgi:hypothetical protein